MLQEKAKVIFNKKVGPSYDDGSLGKKGFVTDLLETGIKENPPDI